MDGNEPAENSTLINDEESEHTMLLGRGINQQQYKGNDLPAENHFACPKSLYAFVSFLSLCVYNLIFYHRVCV